MIADYFTPPKRAAGIVPFLMLWTVLGFVCMTLLGLL